MEKKDSGVASHPNGILDKTMRVKSSKEAMAVSSSLHNNHILPRTLKSPRDYVNGRGDDVELTLLGEADRRQASVDLEDDTLPPRSPGKRPMSRKDKRAMVLLCVLCELLDITLASFRWPDVDRFDTRRSGMWFASFFSSSSYKACYYLSLDLLLVCLIMPSLFCCIKGSSPRFSSFPSQRTSILFSTRNLCFVELSLFT